VDVFEILVDWEVGVSVFGESGGRKGKEGEDTGGKRETYKRQQDLFLL
jgi:hypothetical protein